MTETSNESDVSDPGFGTQAYVIVAFAAFSPLMVWANAGESPVVLTLVFAFAVLAGAGFLLRWILIRIGLDPLGSTYASAVFILVFANTGVFIDRISFGRLVFLALGILGSVLAYRFRDLKVFRFVVLWAALGLIAYPVVATVTKSTNTTVHLEEPEELVLADFESKPDVLIVLFDGYASSVVLEEIYGHDTGPSDELLANQGFTVNEFTIANYGMTQLSVPSLMDMTYIAGETVMSDADLDLLLTKLGGDNRFTSVMKDQGYRSVYVESGWLGTRCADNVDVCVRAPWPDETLADVGYRSLLRGLPGFEVGRSFTRGALHVRSWLENEVGAYLTDDIPDLIYAHVLLPHPPLFVDDSCEADFRSGFPGFEVGHPDMSNAEMAEVRAAYVDQVLCVDSLIASLSSQAGPDTVVIMVGDHGPDSLHQLFFDGEPWSDDQRKERLSVFLAARVPDCGTSVSSIVNVARRVLSCLSGDEVPDLEDRAFEWQVVDDRRQLVEVDPPTS